MEFSPASGIASPKTRVNYVKKIRDNLQNSIKKLTYDISILEGEVSDLNQSIKANRNEIKNKKQEYANYTSILEKLESKTQNLNFEYNYTTETIIRYQKMAQIAGPMPILHDFRHEIEDIRNEIIAMEKEMIECRNQSLLAQKISQAQIRRASLIQNDARLLEKLNSLTVQLSILQYAGDKKLITDSEFIIEKQLTSEELRSELQEILNRKQFEQTKSSDDTKYNDEIKPITDLEKKLFLDTDDRIYREIDSISSSIDLVRAKLNFYLKSERKIDELEKSKRRRLATLEILETTIEKNKKECDSWVSKRNEFQKNDYFLQSQIEMMQNEENLQTQPLIDFLKEKQKQHKKIKDQRSQISTEYKNLTIDTVNADTSTWKRKIDQINSEITALLKSKERIIKRQQSYSKLNALHGIRQILQIERSVLKAESELDSLIMKLSKIRRRKKELNKQINNALLSLTNMGVIAPSYSFKSRSIINE